MIKLNFDEKFYDENGFYRDTYGGGGDEKFRCNYPIALAISPTLPDHEKAVRSIQSALETLQSGMGLCTLSPNDPDYRIGLVKLTIKFFDQKLPEMNVNSDTNEHITFFFLNYESK